MTDRISIAQKLYGFRLSPIDAAVLAITAVISPALHIANIPCWWLLPFVVGHFFLFCNVFRIRCSFELIWGVVLVFNFGAWMIGLNFHWLPVMLCQLPATLLVLLFEIRSEDYHGILAQRVNPSLPAYLARRLTSPAGFPLPNGEIHQSLGPATQERSPRSFPKNQPSPERAGHQHLLSTYPFMNLESLLASIAAGHLPKWCFFWGHTPAKDGSVTKACFSQWWAGHPFEMEGIRYSTAEHWMMAEKARLFGDDNARKKILTATHPNAAKKLGRQVSGFDETVWKVARWDIVVRGNVAKFGKHPALREFLIATGDRIIVEASPYDRIWGIGMTADNPDAENPSRWRGETSSASH